MTQEFNQGEKYILYITDKATGDMFTVTANSRDKFIELMKIIPKRLYINAIQVLERNVDYNEMLAELIRKNLPKDLEIGKKEVKE